MARTLVLLGCWAGVLSGCYAEHVPSRPDVDAGPPGPLCGVTWCRPDETCCGLGGEQRCVPFGGCVPTEPGHDWCPDGSTHCPVGHLCCPGCPGEPSTCAEDVCPDLFCSAPGCNDATPCPETMFCDRDTCGGEGVCRPRPEACDPECPEVCGCDGRTYCAACDANAAGVTVAHEGACAPPAECVGLSYCACEAAPGCAPLANIHSGCVCPCDDPFNCSGVPCDCDCGGADYAGCVPNACPVQGEIDCDPVSCDLVRDERACIQCVCDT